MSNKVKLIGHFINLNRSEDRRAAMQKQLIELKLTQLIHRFPAIEVERELGKLTRSETGCLLSHQKVLLERPTSDWQLVLEDDVIISAFLLKWLNALILNAETNQLDIVFLGQTILYNDVRTHGMMISLIEKHQIDHQSSFRLADAKGFYRYGAFAYLVSAAGRKKLLAVYEENLKMPSPPPVDNQIREAVKRGLIRGAVLIPYAVGLQENAASTMLGRRNADEHALHVSAVNLYLKGHPVPKTPRLADAFLESRIDSRSNHLLHTLYQVLQSAKARSDD